MVEERAHEVAHHATAAVHEASQGASQEGLKELANWVTLLNESWHGSTAHFLHQWENVIFSLTAALFLVGISFLATRKKSRVPTPLQNAVELAVESLDNLITGIIGPRGRAYVPF